MSAFIGDGIQIIEELAPTIGRLVRFTAPIVKRVLRSAFRWIKKNWNTPEGVAGRTLAGTGTIPHNHGGGTAPRGGGGVTAPIVRASRSRIRFTTRRRKKEHYSIPVRRYFSNSYRKR